MIFGARLRRDGVILEGRSLISLVARSKNVDWNLDDGSRVSRKIVKVVCSLLSQLMFVGKTLPLPDTTKVAECYRI